jgi:hypothetical protein
MRASTLKTQGRPMPEGPSNLEFDKITPKLLKTDILLHHESFQESAFLGVKNREIEVNGEEKKRMLRWAIKGQAANHQLEFLHANCDRLRLSALNVQSTFPPRALVCSACGGRTARAIPNNDLSPVWLIRLCLHSNTRRRLCRSARFMTPYESLHKRSHRLKIHGSS